MDDEQIGLAHQIVELMGGMLKRIEALEEATHKLCDNNNSMVQGVSETTAMANLCCSAVIEIAGFVYSLDADGVEKFMRAMAERASESAELSKILERMPEDAAKQIMEALQESRNAEHH